MEKYGGLVDQLGIVFTSISPTHVEATMPITNAILQPHGFVHGGATLSLLETVASFGAQARCNLEVERPFGIGIEARHRKAGRSGTIRGVATFGREEGSSQIWNVVAYDDEGDALSVGTFTTKIVSLERLRQKGLA